MHKYMLCMLCCLLLLLAPACVSKRSQRTAGAAAQAEEPVFSSANPPPGLRLGPSYVSALGEPCYEAYPDSGPATLPRAYCQRQGSWTLLPDIFMTVPHQGGSYQTR